MRPNKRLVLFSTGLIDKNPNVFQKVVTLSGAPCTCIISYVHVYVYVITDMRNFTTLFHHYSFYSTARTYYARQAWPDKADLFCV